MDEYHVMQLLDDLQTMIEGSKTSFGNSQKRTVELDPVINKIDEIRDTLPKELVEARRIVHLEGDIIRNAEQEANSIIADAEMQAANKVSDQEIVRLAENERNAILADAQEQEMQFRWNTYNYADELLKKLETNISNFYDQFGANMSTLINGVQASHESLNANFRP